MMRAHFYFWSIRWIDINNIPLLLLQFDTRMGQKASKSWQQLSSTVAARGTNAVERSSSRGGAGSTMLRNRWHEQDSMEEEDASKQMRFKERDQTQQDFLQSQQQQQSSISTKAFETGEANKEPKNGDENTHNLNKTYPEMPADLIDFLKQVGPLQKMERTDRVNTQVQAKSSRRRRESMKEQEEDHAHGHEEEEDTTSRRTTSQRIQSKMPLMEQVPGYETVRTTNFSTKVVSSSDSVVGGDVFDFYSWLHRKSQSQEQQQETSSLERALTDTDASTRMEATSSEVTNIIKNDNSLLVDEIYIECLEKWRKQQDETRHRGASLSRPPLDLDSPLMDKEDELQYKRWIQNTLDYLSVPILVQDPKNRDGGYDGVSLKQVQDYQRLEGLLLSPVPPHRARLVLEDWQEHNNNNKKKG